MRGAAALSEAFLPDADGERQIRSPKGDDSGSSNSYPEVLGAVSGSRESCQGPFIKT